MKGDAFRQHIRRAFIRLDALFERNQNETNVVSIGVDDRGDSCAGRR